MICFLSFITNIIYSSRKFWLTRVFVAFWDYTIQFVYIVRLEKAFEICDIISNMSHCGHYYLVYLNTIRF